MIHYKWNSYTKHVTITLDGEYLGAIFDVVAARTSAEPGRMWLYDDDGVIVGSLRVVPDIADFEEVRI